MNLQVNASFSGVRRILVMWFAVLLFVLPPGVGRAAGPTSPVQVNDPKSKQKKLEDDQGAKAKQQATVRETLEGAAARRAQEAQRNRAAPAGKDNPPSDLKRGEPSSPSATLDIQPADSDIPPEERNYTFSIKDGTYEQLLEGFARQTGLGVIGQAPKGGKVSFVSSEELTFQEALGRIRILLFKYKPLEPYWLVRRKTHLEVVRVNDVLRFLARERMFRTVEEFRRANLAGHELALVIYTPTSGTIGDLKVVRDFMPDYVRVAPLGGTSVTIFALVEDINKYLDLIPVFVTRKGDPRTVERIKLTHILPSEAVNKLRELTDFGGSGGRVRTPARGRGKEISPLDTMREPEVKLIPEEAQGVLIVRAMQDRIEEIKRLLPYVDVDTSVKGLEPVVILVEHTSPEELIATIQKILAAGSSPAEVGIVKRPSTSRGKASRRSSPPPLTAAGITLLVHPSGDAIIAIADQEGAKRVRDLVQQFDVPDRIGPVRIPVSHADPGEIAATITTLLRGGSAKGKSAAERLQLQQEPGAQALWFTGSRKALEKVRELVATLDVPGQRASLRIVRLRHEQPSFVANMLRELDKGAGTPSIPGKSSRAARSKTAIASKFTPNDEQHRLFILCTDAEWEQYAPVIEQLERAVDQMPPFVRLAVEHVEPKTVIERLSTLLGHIDKRGAGGIRYAPTKGGILVMGASEAQLTDIKSVLAEIDRPMETEQRKFEILYRDVAEIKAAIETLVADGGGSQSPGRRPRPGPKGAAQTVGLLLPEMTIVQMGHSLIVRTTPEKMERVAALIAELDVQETKTKLKAYDGFPPQANIASISDAMASFFSGRMSVVRRKGAAGAAGAGPQFIPQTSLGKLVVIAPPTMFSEIEQLLDVLRGELAVAPREIAFIDVAFADPSELVQQITPLLDIKIHELVTIGKLGDVGRTLGGSTPKVAPRRPRQTTGTGQYYHLAPDARNSRIVIAAPRIVIEHARKLIARFDEPGEDKAAVLRTIVLDQADSAEMVKAVKEMLGPSVRAPVRSESA